MKRSLSTSSLSSLLGITAAVLYLANPFAAPLFMPLADVPRIASDLGGRGQPYALFFDGADVLSGVLNIAACIVLFVTRRAGRPFWWTASLAALIVEGAGAILAALSPLPPHGGSPVHIALSRMDGVGLLASVWLFSAHKERAGRGRWLLFAALLTTTCLLYLLIGDESAGGVVERVIIVETALWIGLFPSLSDAA